MRRYLFIAFMLMSGRVYADTKLSALTADTTAQSTDIFYKVDSPGGTPVSRSISFGNLLNAGATNFVSAIANYVSSVTTNASMNITTVGTSGSTVTLSVNVSSVSLPNSGATAGSYTNTNLTVDSHGLITVASNGTSSGGVSGSTGTIGIIIDGEGSAIIAGSTRSITVPYSCTISSISVVADQSGSIGVHISSSTFANYPILSNMSGTGNGPSLTSQQKNAATPSGWNQTAIAQGDVISFVVDSASTVTWVNIILWLIKT